MAQKRDYATKKKGKTEVYPFWNLEDIKNVVEWFEQNNEWDGYLITLLEMLLVIAIIVILASVLALSIGDYIRRANAAKTSTSSQVSIAKSNIVDKENGLKDKGFGGAFAASST